MRNNNWMVILEMIMAPLSSFSVFNVHFFCTFLKQKIQHYFLTHSEDSEKVKIQKIVNTKQSQNTQTKLRYDIIALRDRSLFLKTMVKF